MEPWSEDTTASLTFSEALRRLTNHLIEAEAITYSCPHVVVCRIGRSVSYIGPFPNALAAIVAADVEAATIADAEAVFSVAPLYAPIAE
jgi:hypothetical protein